MKDHWYKRFWTAAIRWFEHGDLVPLLVFVSAAHYAQVLAEKDYWLIAVAIGLLVDLGHYRTIRAAFRYKTAKGRSKRKAKWFERILSRYSGEVLARWIIAAAMTAISLAYHQRYYTDWSLSAPLPLLIAALAWLQRVDARSGSGSSETKAPHEPAQIPLERPIVSLPAKKSEFICENCAAHYKSQNALNAHRRKCKGKAPLELALHPNGNGKLKTGLPTAG